ncbi:DUF3846 domain-containing protein [Microbacterium hydrocarbonoxydans]|uniref:DUF3846 domain-containing protein n=1 Tax=Microbacterium hydrocarbonoxydans TaxID=273678 RepID=UPI003D960616
MTVSALVLRPDTDALEAVELKPDRGNDTHLLSLYSALGCQWVDVIRLTDDIDAWLDDEGRVNGAPDNVTATNVFRAFGWHLTDGDAVRGSVAFAAHDGVGGMASLSARQREIVEDALAQAKRM